MDLATPVIPGVNTLYLLIGIIALLILLIIMRVKTKFRLMVQNLIYKSETGDIVKGKLYDMVDRVQKSDLDEKMVAVISEILALVPILRLIPKSLVVKILNNYVQKIFDQVKNLLHLYKFDTKAEDKSVNCLVGILDKLSEEEKLVLKTYFNADQEKELNEKLNKMVDEYLTKVKSAIKK